MDPAITPPKIIEAVPAVYPDLPIGEGSNACCMIVATIGTDGLVVNARAIRFPDSPFAQAALDAVRQSKYEPGLLNNRPVAVRVHVPVRFRVDRSPAVPKIALMRTTNPEGQAADYPPRATHSVNPSYTEEARRKKINGIVILSVLVTEEGLPSDIRVVRSLGYGLDEKAIEAVSQYRFRPAIKDGKPVPYRLEIESNFQIY
jgi:TonB family protein